MAASLLPSGLVARVLSERGESWSLRPARQADPEAERGIHVIHDATDEMSLPCGNDDRTTEESEPNGLAGRPDGQGAGVVAGECPVHVADIAFDSDHEFFVDDCQGDPDTCVAIVEAGLNITNLIYVRDVKITHRISTIVIRTDPESDIYAGFPDGSDFGGMLNTLREEWNRTMQDIPYDMAYLLTGKPNPQYGGVAFVGVVCTSSRYGMGIGGWGYEGIFRHEVGHNWGASHSCGVERRYIMCGNSIDAISAFNIRVMTAHRDSRSCLVMGSHPSDPAPPFVRLDRVITLQERGPLAIEALRGDTDINCDRLLLAGHDTNDANLLPSLGGGDDHLR